MTATKAGDVRLADEATVLCGEAVGIEAIWLCVFTDELTFADDFVGLAGVTDRCVRRWSADLLASWPGFKGNVFVLVGFRVISFTGFLPIFVSPRIIP